MGYWKAKSELKLMKDFKNDVRRLFEMEDSVREWIPPNPRFAVSPSERQKALQRAARRRVEGYEEVRERVAKGIVKAVRG